MVVPVGCCCCCCCSCRCWHHGLILGRYRKFACIDRSFPCLTDSHENDPSSEKANTIFNGAMRNRAAWETFGLEKKCRKSKRGHCGHTQKCVQSLSNTAVIYLQRLQQPRTLGRIIVVDGFCHQRDTVVLHLVPVCLLLVMAAFNSFSLDTAQLSDSCTREKETC